MNEWVVKEHPDFFRDLDKLSTKELEIFYKKKKKIKEDPLRLKHQRFRKRLHSLREKFL